MPREENKKLKVLVPIVLVLAAIGIGFAVLRNTGKQSLPDQQPSAAGQSPEKAPTGPTEAKGAETKTAETKTPEAKQPETKTAQEPVKAAADGKPQEPAVKPTVPVASAPKYRARVSAAGGAPRAIGGLDEKGSAMMELEFSPRGAGISSLKLAKHFETIKKDIHLELQAAREAGRPDTKARMQVVPMSVLGVQVDGVFVETLSQGIWREGERPGEFVADIVTGEGVQERDAVRLTRRYELADGSYTVRVHQRAQNLTDKPVSVKWFLMGPSELPYDKVAYGGDNRRLRFGYLLEPANDPGRQYVLGSDFLYDHLAMVREHEGAKEKLFQVEQWPNERSAKRRYDLAWVGMTNRYFGVVVAPLLPDQPKSKVFTAIETVDRLRFDELQGTTAVPMLATRLNTVATEVAAGQSQDVPMALYAGPLSAREIRKDPVARAAGVDEIVVLRFSGCCGDWCTFQWLTAPVLGLLRVLHDYVVFDWGVAIIVLVLIVRTIMHPVTKWSQIRMQRFGKQMQAMGPKMQKLKEKYADDAKTLQAETAKLWREEGVNPAGMLGCFPIFLQTPVWIAVSATIMFAAELRHQPAFYGIFQALGTPEKPFWFLGDLGEPDRLILFDHAYTLLWFVEVQSLNVLPLLLAIVFFVQQKYLTPPTTSTMTPEQELQMKLMKWVTVFLFPVLMYNAPSGMALYFTANSSLAILESRRIKKHIEKHDLLNLDKMKAERTARAAGRPARGGGFLARVQEMAEKQRQNAEQKARKKR